jgi:hypothetical protein
MPANKATRPQPRDQENLTMKFTAMQKLADDLDEFTVKYGYTVTNALMVYSEHMTKDADEIQAAYDTIKDEPEARARQDKSMITTEGLRWSVQAIREAVSQADAAREAWEALTDLDDED